MTNFLSGKKKILTMILGIMVGLLITFGLDLGEVNVIAGAVVSLASTVSYLFIEGKIDVERIKRAAEDINEIIEYIGGEEPEEEYIDESAWPVPLDNEEDDTTEPDETGQGGDM